jgi:hypothetical protein
MDEAINAIEARSPSPKVKEDNWRTNAFNGYADFNIPN